MAAVTSPVEFDAEGREIYRAAHYPPKGVRCPICGRDLVEGEAIGSRRRGGSDSLPVLVMTCAACGDGTSDLSREK